MGNFALSTIILATLFGLISIIIIMTIYTLINGLRFKNLTKDLHGKTRFPQLGRLQAKPKAPIFRNRNKFLYESLSVEKQTNLVHIVSDKDRSQYSKGK